jgi:hypothetical protein
MSDSSLLRSLLPYAWRRYLRDRLVRFQVKHICGPSSVDLADDEAVVSCVVKNGEYYIEEFIRHYTLLGARHIFLLDNLSTDRTVALAARHQNVTIWQSSISVGSHQGLLQRFLLRGMKTRGWCIHADIDELFDFPCSARLSLRQFLAYLNSCDYTAVLTQMLDMFADEPLSYLYETKTEPLGETYRYYDVSDLLRIPYQDARVARTYGANNSLGYKQTDLLYGGIRKDLYGTEWFINCLLTKHCLFRLNSGLDLFRHVHFVDNARLADVSCLMRHYKLVSNVLQTARQNRANLHGISKGYDALLCFLLEHPDHRLKRSSASEWESADRLVDAGFLFASDKYMHYVEANASVDRARPSMQEACPTLR